MIDVDEKEPGPSFGLAAAAVLRPYSAPAGGTGDLCVIIDFNSSICYSVIVFLIVMTIQTLPTGQNNVHLT